MAEKLCRVTITDIKGGGHVVEVKASSLFEAVAQAVKLKDGHIATDGFRRLEVPPHSGTRGSTSNRHHQPNGDPESAIS
jgi:hypothetical protein